MSLLSAFGRTLPGQGLRSLLWQMRSLRWRAAPGWQANQRRLREWQDRHQGQRCFIIGNGPSLQRMDLEPLRGEHTFGLNRINLLFPRLGFHTTYLVAINKLVIEQCREELTQLPMPRFFSWHAPTSVGRSSGAHLLRTHWQTLGFSTDPTRYIYEGATVTFAAMQIAYHMGFSQVILIGVDHSFATTGTPHRTVTSGGADPNHFDPSYFGKGFRWQLPDLPTSELAYSLAKQRFATAGREILDATVDGKLTVFPKADFAALF